VSKGYKTISYKQPDRILDRMIELGVDLRDHSTQKFPNRCPLFTAIKVLQIKKEDDMFIPRNVLVRKLILNGATLKTITDPSRTFNLPWLDVDGFRNYL
jgi:hypothetical protein